MATKTIGIGVGANTRNFATLAAYSSYLNALTLTAPEVAEFYMDTGAVPDNANITLSGWAGGSATNTVTLRPAAGQGFRDNANVLTNALRYNDANGAAIVNVISASTNYSFGSWVVIDGMQIAADHSSGGNAVFMGSNCVIRNSIIRSRSPTGYVLILNGATNVVENTILHAAGGGAGIQANNTGNTVTSCLIVALAGGTSETFHTTYTTLTIKNTAAIGFTYGLGAEGAGGASATSTNNATSLATFNAANWGTAGQASITAAEFVSITPGSEDFRLSASSVKLRDNGVTAGPAYGIGGTSRPQGSAYDIGPWEYAVAAPTPSATISYTEANDTATIAGNVTITGVAAAIAYTEANDTSAISGSATTTDGTITTGVFKNNTGSILASLTALTVTLLNATTLAFVKTFTSKNTNGSGIMVLTDSLIVSGTQYAVVTTNASGTLGVEKYTAA